jgi:pimeloyl-ACP methyl ester carboxylesterase
MDEFTVESDGVRLAGEEAGEGVPVVLLHGLTATRRYVVMGSRALERGGHRVVTYDARGHGRSAPAPAPDAYGYAALAADLGAVLDDRGIDRAVLAGSSMGAHTLLRFAIAHPERVAALGVITPAFDPEDDSGTDLARWDALADGLRAGGVEGFVEAYDVGSAPAKWRDTIRTVLEQRIGAHEHPEAVADALRAVPRSRPFEAWDELAALDVPTVVVASRDEADPGHPLAIGERFAEAIPGPSCARRTRARRRSPGRAGSCRR